MTRRLRGTLAWRVARPGPRRDLGRAEGVGACVRRRRPRRRRLLPKEQPRSAGCRRSHRRRRSSMTGRRSMIAGHDHRDRALARIRYVCSNVRRLGRGVRRTRCRHRVDRRRAADRRGAPSCRAGCDLFRVGLGLSHATARDAPNRTCRNRSSVLERGGCDRRLLAADGALPLADPRAGTGACGHPRDPAARRPVQCRRVARAVRLSRCARDWRGLHAYLRPAACLDRGFCRPARRDGSTKSSRPPGPIAVALVGHSMGGLVARAYLRRYGSGKVRWLLTLGTPHHGSVHAWLFPGVSLAQLRPGSAWLAELNRDEGKPFAMRFVSLWSWHDSMVAPQASSRLGGAVNVELDGIGHNALLGDSDVFELRREGARERVRRTSRGLRADIESTSSRRSRPRGRRAAHGGQSSPRSPTSESPA